MQRTTLILLILLAAVAATYARTVTFDFSLWDDPGTVASNPRLNPPTWSGVLHYWRQPALGLYTPVTYSAWSALAAVGWVDQPDERGIRLNPAVFHLANVVVHAISAMVVFAILRRLVGRDWPACLGALLYAMHPLQVEAVTWVSGLKDLLAGCLSLLAIWQYLVFATAEDRTRRRLAYALATVCLVLAMLSKPSAMVAPLMVLIVDVLVLRRGWREAAMALGPWFVLSAGCAVLAKVVQPALSVAATPLWARPLLVGDSLAFYLYKLVVPLNLAIDYGRRPGVLMEQWWFYVTWIVPALLAVLLLRNWRRWPMLLAAGALFVAGALPMLGWTRFLFQMYSTTADHYLYLAMLGPALAAAWVLTAVGGRRIYAAAVAIVALLGMRSMLQIDHWREDQALFEHTIDVNPRSFAGYNNLGVVHLQRGEWATAERHFRVAASLNAAYYDAHDNLAHVLTLQGRADEAIGHIRQSLRIRESLPAEASGNYVEFYRHLGQILISRGRYEEAIAELDRLAELRPDDEQARAMLEQARQRRDATTQPEPP